MSPRGGKRSNSGRKAPEGVRTNRSIKMSDAEWQNLQALADKNNMTASEYVRDFIKKEIENNEKS